MVHMTNMLSVTFVHSCCDVQELERWQRTRSEEFANMLAGLATVEHAFHRRAAGVWQAVAADLSGDKGGGSGDGGSTGAGPSSR